jgi:dTMP kinase
MLVAAGESVHVTAEPSEGPIGVLCRELTESVTGHALACLYAADRYHHVETEIRPHAQQRLTVISDRYIPSGLVMQRFDGIDPTFLWQLNAEADRPDLAVILEADPEVIAERLAERGPHNRFQQSPDSSHAEAYFYRQATDRLIQAGFDVLRVECNQRSAEASAGFIRDRLLAFFGSSPGGGITR